MRIGEILVMNDLISDAQLEEVLKEQGHTRKKLGEILLDQGWMSERQLVEVLEFQLGFPVVNLYETKVDVKATQLISEVLARKHCVLPIGYSRDKIKVAMVDPLNYEAMEEIRMAVGLAVQPLIAMRSEIEQAITRYYGMQDSMEELLDDIGVAPEQDKQDQEAQDQASPVVKLVNQLIQSAVQQRASDIHVDPQEEQVIIRLRIDGVLHVEKTLPKSMQSVITARLKIIAKLNIAERRLPQDGRIQTQIDQRHIDIRVSTLPSVHGESVVLRILDQSAGIKQMTDLGLSEGNLAAFIKMLQKPNGIMLISGPTGSGKTSTLYSALNYLNNDQMKIITIEDPVEYRMSGITQVQVNTQVGLTFASGLRSMLRQDPNIVMVGEIRDSDTAEIAVRASQTGHLVLSTIHTNNAVSTISRLIDMEIDTYLIASSLSCVVAQGLVRKICKECSRSVPAREEEILLLEENALVQVDDRKGTESNGYGFFRKSGKASGEIRLSVKRGEGCSTCHNTGYHGRLAIHEVLVIDETMRRMISQNRPVDELKRHALENGFKSLLKDGLQKVLDGQTTIDEVLKAVSEE